MNNRIFSRYSFHDFEFQHYEDVEETLFYSAEQPLHQPDSPCPLFVNGVPLGRIEPQLGLRRRQRHSRQTYT